MEKCAILHFGCIQWFACRAILVPAELLVIHPSNVGVTLVTARMYLKLTAEITFA